jgi:hypothetical protein
MARVKHTGWERSKVRKGGLFTNGTCPLCRVLSLKGVAVSATHTILAARCAWFPGTASLSKHCALRRGVEIRRIKREDGSVLALAITATPLDLQEVM